MPGLLTHALRVLRPLAGLASFVSFRSTAVADGTLSLPCVDRRWASDELEVPPEASPEEVRRSILKRLAGDDFLPSPACRGAIRVLTTPESSPVPLPPTAHWKQEQQVRSEIEEFAFRFFQFPLAERRAQWEWLEQKSRFSPALRCRLRLLEPGLELERPVRFGLSDVGELADWILDGFVLPPQRRAALRREQLAQVTFDPRRWLQAAFNLQAQYPQIARLDAEFLEDLRDRMGRPRLLAESISETQGWGDRIDRLFERIFSPWGILIYIATISGAAFVAAMINDPTPNVRRPPYHQSLTSEDRKRLEEGFARLLILAERSRLLEEQEEKLAADPDNWNLRFEIAQEHLFLVELELERLAYDRDRVREHSRRAAEHYCRLLLDVDPANKTFRQGLWTACLGAEDEVLVYDLARNFAEHASERLSSDQKGPDDRTLTAWSELAWKLLQQAVADGVRDFDAIEQDPQWAAIRLRPGYTEWLDCVSSPTDSSAEPLP